MARCRRRARARGLDIASRSPDPLIRPGVPMSCPGPSPRPSPGPRPRAGARSRGRVRSRAGADVGGEPRLEAGWFSCRVVLGVPGPWSPVRARSS
ncbi:hypothetical protein C6376_06190 [Streptomyces sp. P3]|nr:hypothetical protein C6376_06190 [Streptomyces sp. P3]